MLRIYYYCVQVAFVKLSAKLHSGPSHDFSTKNSFLILIDPVDTKPEKFENCVFTTKPHQIFTVRTTLETFESAQSLVIFEL